MRKGCGLLPLLVLMLAAPLAAGQASYTLEVDADEVYVGESFSARLILRNARSYSDPQPPTIPDCTIQVGGQRSFTQFVNGRRSEQLTLTYLLTPRKPGVLRIPPFELQVDGRAVQTDPVEVRVRPAADRATEARDRDGVPLLLAEVQCHADRLYIGQRARFTLTVQVKIPSGATGSRLTANDLYGLMSNSRTGFGPFAEPQRADRRRLEFNSKAWNYYEFSMPGDVIMDRTGPVTFDDLVLEMEYPERITRDIFGRARVERARRLSIRPLVIAPEVQDLPQDGVPAGFEGAVGRFTLQVEADRTEVRVGDPIELRLSVSGRGPLETLARPRLTEQEQLTRDFRVQDEALTGEMVGNRRVFTQTIRAKRSGIDAIPAIDLPYFNPERGQYEIAHSEPIPIRVQASEKAKAADLLDLAAADENRETVSAVDGLRGNITGERIVLQRVRPVGWGHVAVATVVPAAAFGGFWLLTVVQTARRGDPLLRRRQRAMRTAEQKLSDVQDPGAVAAILTGYVADRSGAPEGSLTGADALAVLRERDAEPQLVTDVQRLVEAAEAAAYGGAALTTDLVQDARGCLRRLEGLSW